MDRMTPYKKFSRGLSALVFFLCTTLATLGQRFEFGGGIGFLNYKGDLNPHQNLLLSRPGVQALFRYNFSMAVVGRANLLVGTLVGDGKLSPNIYTSQIQPLNFSTPLIEFSGLMEYNFFNFRNPKNRFIFGSPYLMGGPGIFIFTSSPAEKFGAVSSIQFAPVLGFGYKQQIGQFWNIGFEFGGRFPLTDFVDNVGDRDPLSGFQRGNLYDSDVYTFWGINLTYTIKEVICPFDYQQSDENQK